MPKEPAVEWNDRLYTYDLYTYLSCIASFLQASALRNPKQSISFSFCSSSINRELLQYCTTKLRTSGKMPEEKNVHVLRNSLHPITLICQRPLHFVFITFKEVGVS